MSGSNSSGRAAAPAADPVGLTVHSVDMPQTDGSGQRTRRGRFVMLLVLLTCAAPVLLSYFTYFVVRPGARSNYATLIQPTRGLPAELPLRDLGGQPVAASSLHGQWLLAVVAGGDCDKRCETLLYDQRQLREMTGREQDRIDRVWLVTDDAPLRPAIARAMQSGDAGTVLRVPRAALARWLAPEPGHALEDHLYLVDPMGEWMMRTPAELDPMKFKRDLERLLRASSSWDRPGREPL
ncbi:MAG TPA: hypothetical protein VLA16_08395 [Ideonella sp.]|nr:hypothetical protein [Ideonella sp.]